jgi:AAA family ATP:ADP antiporter
MLPGAPSSDPPAKFRLFDVRTGEWGKALGMSAYFFLIISVFWVVKPIKRGVILGFYRERPFELFTSWHGAEVEQLAKIVNVFVALAAVALFTIAVRRFRRVAVVYVCCGVFAAGFALFGATIESPSATLVWSFYSFGDLFNTVMVALFWAFMNDLVDSDQAKRLYGIVGLGGVLGGLFGATLVRQAVEGLGRASLLAACVVPLVTVAVIAAYVDRVAHRRFGRIGHRLEARQRGVLLEGARLVTGSRYLTGIAATILLYEIVSNIVDFQLSATAQRVIEGDTERDAFFALVGQATGIVSVVVQLLVTSWVMRRYGIGVALMFLPIAILAGSVGFLAVSTLVFATMMSASDNALNYSIQQSAKEALYVPTTRDEKYKAKAFIDMFVQRSAKLLAVGLNLAFAAWIGLADVRWLSIGTVVALLAWLPLAGYLGRRFEDRSAARKAESLAGSGTPDPSAMPASGAAAVAE